MANTPHPPARAQSSCDGIYKTCKPLVSAINKAKNKIIDIAVSMIEKQFGGSLPAEAKTQINKIKDADACAAAFEGHCQDGICAALGDPVNQILALAGKVPHNGPPHQHVAALSVFAHPREQMPAVVRSLGARGAHATAVDILAGTLAHVARASREAAALRSTVAPGTLRPASLVDADTDTDGAPKIVYSTDGGYKAFAAGCSVQTSKDTNCDVGGGGGGLSGIGGAAGLVGIIAGVVAGVALITVIAVVVVRRNRNAVAGSHYQNVAAGGPPPANPYYAQP
jgi:hypothetical protein